ncbi:hypothetical protein SUVZ_02G1220 [Saccharomyces uvarum]|uniref:Rcr1p n=1 Tax=Saccharomyces uvarum TaxID=230603 RepID=A0ABN8WQZ6_SACUV|nr:hypothetical protein SUVZ_02G1220 [Saccharomyces uvarum]
MGLVLYGKEVVELTKRADANNTSKYVDYYGTSFGSSSWQWGRWILFVLFIAAILIIIMYTALINKRRRRIGRAPIRGTAWLTPPSYGQSQQQHTGNVQQRTDDYVPEYTETANEHDLGYYDQRGEFHPNDKVAQVSPVQECSSESINSLERPPAAVVHQPNSSDLEYDLTRPNNRQVPVASGMEGQTQESLEVSGTEEITPPGRAKLNAK